MTKKIHQPRRKKHKVFLLSIIILAILIRVAFVITKIDQVNSDEAIIGIMAKDIAKGERPIFFYGQSYYVPWESYLAAPIVSVFGLNQYSIRVIPIIISAATCLVFYFLGSRIGSSKLGLGSALVSAIPPITFLRRQIKGDAAFAIVLFLGTLLLVILIDYANEPEILRLLPIATIAIIGFGSHPIMGYYILTGLIVILSTWFSKRFTDTLDALTWIRYLVLLSGLILLTLVFYISELISLFRNFIHLFKDTLPILLGFYNSASYSSHQKDIMQAGMPLLIISMSLLKKHQFKRR